MDIREANTTAEEAGERPGPPMAVVLVLILAGLFAVYGPHLHNGFTYDDHPQIERNPALDPGASWAAPFSGDLWAHASAEVGSRRPYYRPLLVVAYRVVKVLFGPSPFGFHLAGLLLHAAAAALVLLVLRLLGLPGRIAAVATAVFAFHPAAAETLYSAADLSEQLLFLGTLGTLACLIAARGRGGRRRLGLLAASFACALAAQLSKETALVLGPLALAEVLRTPRADWRRNALATWPVWAATAATLALRIAAVGLPLGGANADLLSSIGLFGAGILWSARRLVAPHPLTLFHSFPQAPPPGWVVAAGLAALLALGALLVVARRKPARLFWAAWLLLPTSIPILAVFASAPPASGVVVADRHLLVALAPFAAILALGFESLLDSVEGEVMRRRLRIILVVLACTLGGILSHNAGTAFRSDEALFLHAVEHAPGNPAVRIGVGNALTARGDLEGALAHYEAAVRSSPRLAQARLNLGATLLKLGRPAEALPQLEAGVSLAPSLAGANRLLGTALRDLGRLPEAEVAFEKELEVDPASVPALLDLGTALYLRGDRAGAQARWQEALRLAPDHPEALYNLGLLHRDGGDALQARAYWSRFAAAPGDGFAAQREQVRRWLARGEGR